MRLSRKGAKTSLNAPIESVLGAEGMMAPDIKKS